MQEHGLSSSNYTYDQSGCFMQVHMKVPPLCCWLWQGVEPLSLWALCFGGDPPGEVVQLVDLQICWFAELLWLHTSRRRKALQADPRRWVLTAGYFGQTGAPLTHVFFFFYQARVQTFEITSVNRDEFKPEESRNDTHKGFTWGWG